MKHNKGFTLVELLAVIVILAIIMIIAIPTVLDTLNNARKKTFLEYIDKVASTTQTKYTEDQLNNKVGGSSSIIYNVKNDLGLSSTGDFDGFVLIDNQNIYITLYNDDFAVYGLEYGKIDDSNIYNKATVTDNLLTIENLAKSAGVEEYTYIQNNNYQTGEVTLTKAVFDTGEKVNAAIKTLANGTTTNADTVDELVQHIKYTRDINNAPDNKVLISSSSSEEPVYVWWDNNTKTIYIGCKNNKVYLNNNATKQFQRFENLIDIDLSHYLSDECRSLYRFVAEDHNLESIDMKHFNTSRVENFRGLFLQLRKVTEIDVSTWNTSNAQKFGYMFSQIPKLTSLDLSSFDTSKVTDMECFITSTSIKELHLENFNTSIVTNMTSMFSRNELLEKIYVSNKFVTTSVTKGGSMFTADFLLNGAYDKNKVSYEYINMYLTYV